MFTNGLRRKYLAPQIELETITLRLIGVTRSSSRFAAGEVDRFRELAQEARAATNSYVAGVVERAETERAGRLFRDRLRQEDAERIG